MTEASGGSEAYEHRQRSFNARISIIMVVLLIGLVFYFSPTWTIALTFFLGGVLGQAVRLLLKFAYQEHTKR